MKNEQKKIDKYPMKYVSYSQLNLYKTCKKAFKFQYIDKAPRTDSKYMAFGRVMHEVFEAHGKALLFEKDFTFDDALNMFRPELLKIDRSLFDSKDEVKDFYIKGGTALKHYFDAYGDYKPLFLERKFNKRCIGDLPPLLSYVDRIDGKADDASTWIITDYKTGNAPKDKQYIRNDIQLAFYVIQIFTEFGAFPQAVQFYHPVPNKFQTAIHIGDGKYRYQGQREPVVEFDVNEVVLEVSTMVNQIRSIDWTTYKPICSCGFLMNDHCKEDNKKSDNGWDSV